MEGLYLSVQNNGNKYWRLKYRYFNAERCLSLGKYPNVTLQEARKLKDNAKQLVAIGKDPSSAKNKQKELNKFDGQQTVELVTWEWYERQKSSWTPRHANIVKARLKRTLVNKLGKWPFKDLTTQVLSNCIQEAEQQSPELGKRLLQFLIRICRYAHLTGRLEKDITFGLKDVLSKISGENYASIEVEEIPDFIKKLYEPIEGIGLVKNYATKLLMHLLTRTMELVNAERSEFNLEKCVWIVPASRMKMNRPHLVPLSRQSIVLLKELDKIYGKNRKFLLPSPQNKHKPVCKHIILKEIDRIGYKNRMTGHGFRAMGLTVGTETLKFKFDVIDRQLSHVPKGETRQAYDRAKYIDERTAFMQAYSDYLESFTKPNSKRGNNVRPIYYFQPHTATNTTFKFFRRDEGSKQYQPFQSQQGNKIRSLPNSKKEWAFTRLDSSANSGMYR